MFRISNVLLYVFRVLRVCWFYRLTGLWRVLLRVESLECVWGLGFGVWGSGCGCAAVLSRSLKPQSLISCACKSYHSGHRARVLYIYIYMYIPFRCSPYTTTVQHTPIPIIRAPSVGMLRCLRFLCKCLDIRSILCENNAAVPHLMLKVYGFRIRGLSG